MPRGHGDQPPRTYVIDGHWPHATLHPDAPPGAHYAQEIARRLAAAMTSLPTSARALAERAGISHPIIGRILNGDGSTDIGTVARLEVTLNTRLYPDGLYRELRTPTPDQ
ncbi:helix-turn-helix domain-containing protein [Catellatospora methionotrophica]|uniref:helix-turn-helix domain-containing protein n=1 Tax=Catellatospora methionotrophica TaxID=121620 RepID=UPI0033CCC3A5